MSALDEGVVDSHGADYHTGSCICGRVGEVAAREEAV